MKRLYSQFALPLLVKELTERAARKRTYVVRVLFAALLFVTFGFLSHDAQGNLNQGVLSMLGSGSELLEGLLHAQIAGIFLFLPAMAAGQLAFEKERDSLALLFLTRLSPWQILFEKYLSALVPIFSLLLLAMPMAAIAYAYGGITRADIGWGIYTLALLAFQVAALALMFSAWCRTTSGAFISTYFAGALLYFLTPIAALFEMLFIPRASPSAGDWWTWVPCLFPPAIREYYDDNNQSIKFLLIANAPAWISIALFLGLARFFLVRRAFVKGKNPALLLFQWLDGLMQRLNRRAGNIQFGKAKSSLPGAHPIAWREVKRNVLARPHYLFRILVLVEVPTLGLGFMQIYDHRSGNMGLLLGMLSILAVLAISVNAANAFVSERVQQTLDVLLSTPISAREIVTQKVRAMHRLLYVSAVPLLSLFVMNWSMAQDIPRPYGFESPALYLTCSLLALAIYLPLALWLSLWIGLKTKTRLSAILSALGAIVFWCAAPVFLAKLLSSSYARISLADEWPWLLKLSPIFVPILNQDDSLKTIGIPWLAVASNFAFYGACLWLIRWRCLSRADFYLRQANKG